MSKQSKQRRAKSASQLEREIKTSGSRNAHKRKQAASKQAPKTTVNPMSLPMVQVRMTANGPVAAPYVPPINPLTTLRRLDHEAAIALITKQRELHQQLAIVAADLLTQVGKAHDHAAGFRHAPETCANCAAIEKEKR